MAYKTILYDVADKILTITLNRPDKLNAFTGTMLHELIDAFDAPTRTTTSAPSSSPARAAASAPAPTSPPVPTRSTATRGAGRSKRNADGPVDYSDRTCATAAGA